MLWVIFEVCYYIDLEIYIFELMGMGENLVKLFEIKWGEGVIVWVLYDSVGFLLMFVVYFESLVVVGVVVCEFNLVNLF